VNSPYSLVEVAAFLEANSSDGQHSATSSEIHIVAASLNSESGTAFSKTHPSIVDLYPNLFGADMRRATKEWLILYRQDSRASHSLTAGSNSLETMSGMPGLKPSNVSESSNLQSCSSKTSLDFSQATDISQASSKIWKEQGIMQHGHVLERNILVLPIVENDSGWWLTPIKQEGRQAYQQRPEGKSGEQINTTTMVKNIFGLLLLWNVSMNGRLRDSLTQNEADALIAEMKSVFCMESTNADAPPMNAIVKVAMNGLPTQMQLFVSGAVKETSMNLSWLESLMGMPEGWTGLKPLETHKWESWRRSHFKRLIAFCAE